MFWRASATSINHAPTFGKILHLCEDYRLTVQEGEPDLSVLSFCGVGLQSGGVQVEEFKTSLGSTPTIYYIADLNRSWWNNGHIESVLEKAAEHGRRRCPNAAFTAIGNSMGGSGAILATHLYSEISACLAFVPQYCVKKDFAEKRWMNYRKGIRKHRWATFSLKPKSPNVLQTLVYGQNEDKTHRSLFLADGFSVQVFGDCGHKVARHLRESNNGAYLHLVGQVVTQNRADLLL